MTKELTGIWALIFVAGAFLGALTVMANEWYWRRKHKFHLSCPNCGDETDIPYRDWEAAMLRVARFVGVHSHCHHHERNLQ